VCNSRTVSLCGNVISKFLMYYSCKLFYFLLLYFRAAVSACFYVRLSCLRCLNSCCVFDDFLSDKLNDDDDDDGNDNDDDDDDDDGCSS